MPASPSTSFARGSIEGISSEEIRPGSARRHPFCDIRTIAFRYDTSPMTPRVRARYNSAARLTPQCSFSSANCAQARPAVELGEQGRDLLCRHQELGGEAMGLVFGNLAPGFGIMMHDQVTELMGYVEPLSVVVVLHRVQNDDRSGRSV